MSLKNDAQSSFKSARQSAHRRHLDRADRDRPAVLAARRVPPGVDPGQPVGARRALALHPRSERQRPAGRHRREHRDGLAGSGGVRDASRRPAAPASVRGDQPRLAEVDEAQARDRATGPVLERDPDPDRLPGVQPVRLGEARSGEGGRRRRLGWAAGRRPTMHEGLRRARVRRPQSAGAVPSAPFHSQKSSFADPLDGPILELLLKFQRE